MKDFAIVTIRGSHTNIILFDSLADVEHYIADRADMLAECFMWYIVQVLKRSQAEHAAALDVIAKMGVSS